MHKDVLDTFEAFEGVIEEQVSHEEKMRLYKMVLVDIAQNYKPLRTTEFCADTEKLFVDMKKQATRIISCDAKKWKIKTDRIISKKGSLGNIVYEYTPTDVTEFTPCPYKGLAVLYGMLAEWYLSKGMFDEAYDYQQQFKEFARDLWEEQN